MSNRWGAGYTPKTTTSECATIDITSLRPQPGQVVYIPKLGQVVQLTSTRPNYGGLRWWYLCPRCGARCAKLYLPPGSGWFACRGCHNLTYASAQRARKPTGYLGALGQMIEDHQRLQRVRVRLGRAQPGSARWQHWQKMQRKWGSRLASTTQSIRASEL